MEHFSQAGAILDSYLPLTSKFVDELVTVKSQTLVIFSRLATVSSESFMVSLRVIATQCTKLQKISITPSEPGDYVHKVASPIPTG